MKKIIFLLVFLMFILPVSARIEDLIEQSVPVSYCSGAYELEAVYISGDEVKFRLNSETSPLLVYHDLYRFQEGSSIYVREILEEEAKEGPDRVSIRFYPVFCPETEDAEEPGEEEVIEQPPAPELYEEVPAEEPEEMPSLLKIIISWLKNIFS